MKLSLPEGLRNWKELSEKYRTALMVLAVGVVLMLLPSGEEAPAKECAAQETGASECFDLEGFEQRLARTLSRVEGAGETTVLLTLKSGSRQVLAQNLEQDGERTVSTAVTVGRSGSDQQVVPLQIISPRFQGALVICPGGDDPQVRLQLVAAVTALTGLGSNHISICKST